jgi:hypothetical protein
MGRKLVRPAKVAKPLHVEVVVYRQLLTGEDAQFKFVVEAHSIPDLMQGVDDMMQSVKKSYEKKAKEPIDVTPAVNPEQEGETHE